MQSNVDSRCKVKAEGEKWRSRDWRKLLLNEPKARKPRRVVIDPKTQTSSSTDASKKQSGVKSFEMWLKRKRFEPFLIKITNLIPL